MSAFSDAQIVRHLSRRPLTTGNTGSNARYAESSQEEADPGTGQNGKPFGVVAILLQTYAHVKHNRTVFRFGRHRDPPPPDWVPHAAHCCLYYLSSVDSARSGKRFLRQRKRSSQLESMDNPGSIKTITR